MEGYSIWERDGHMADVGSLEDNLLVCRKTRLMFVMLVDRVLRGCRCSVDLNLFHKFGFSKKVQVFLEAFTSCQESDGGRNIPHMLRFLKVYFM